MLNENELYQSFPGIRPVGNKDSIIKTLVDLTKGKKLGEDNLVIVEGLWAYEKLIKGRVKIESFVFCPQFIESAAELNIVNSIIAMARSAYLISPKLCEKLSSQEGREGFFLLCRLPEYKLKDVRLGSNNLVVILDGVEQAGNIGTIIRSVDGAGGEAVVICNSKVRKNNTKLVKAAMGACFTLPVIQADIGEAVEWLAKQGFKIVLTSLTAEQSYFDIDYSGRIAIVAGNEIHGVSEAWSSHPCEPVIIPMLGGADSLNVGIATTLVTYEASMRQKGLIKRGL